MAAKKTGLGKGLDSLIADKTPKTQKKNAENTDGAVMMNITKVEPNREQPRKKFDEDALLELSELSNVTAVKEASGNISQIAKIKALCGDKLDIYSGNDDQVTAILALGGIGVISVLANVVPKAVHEMVMSYLTGDTNKSLSLQLEYLKLANDLFIETNPIPVKTALNLMGKEAGDLRLPLYEMDENNLILLSEEVVNNNFEVTEIAEKISKLIHPIN